MKRCGRCKQEKEENQFYLKIRRGKPRLDSWCKDCYKEREKDPKRKEYNRRRAASKEKKEYFKELLKRPSYKMMRKEYNKSDYYRTRRIETATIRRLGGGAYWKLMIRYYAPNGICPVCHKKKPMVADHVIPFVISKDSHFANMQPICSECNAKKGKTIIDYRRDKGKYAEQIDVLIELANHK